MYHFSSVSDSILKFGVTKPSSSLLSKTRVRLYQHHDKLKFLAPVNTNYSTLVKTNIFVAYTQSITESNNIHKR